MIDSKGAFIKVHCDNCPNSINTGTPHFMRAMEIIKESGWKNKKSGEEWLNFCSDDCKNER